MGRTRGSRRRGDTGSIRGRGARWLAVAALVATAGCSGGSLLEPELDELARAERQWSLYGPRDYTYVLTPVCYCPYTPRQVTVRNGAVVAVEPLQIEEPLPGTELTGSTIDALLERVRRDLESHPHRVRLDFHPALGYPTDVWFDYEENVADEEWGFTVADLRSID